MTGEGLRERFAPLLADPGRAVVATDYDGTLAPIVDDPARAVPAEGAIQALVALSGHVGRLAVLTGRPAAAAVLVGGLDAVPGLTVVGRYGAERWTGGSMVSTGAEPPGAAAEAAVAAALAETRALLEGRWAAAGVVVETKGPAFAVHTRRADDPSGALEQLRDPVAAVAARHGLRLEPGRLVLELRPAGADKGAALAALATSGPRPSAVLYAGDDLGDLAAFAVVHRLRDEGVPGWAVAAASAEAPEVAAAADGVVAGPAGVVELLAELGRLLS